MDEARGTFRRSRIAVGILAAFAAPAGAQQSPGQPLGTEVQSTFRTQPFQRSPAIAADADGDYLLVYVDDYDDFDDYGNGIGALKFDRFGRFVAPGGGLDTNGGEPVVVNTTITGTQDAPAVAMDPDGDAVVVWSSGLSDTPRYDVFFQRFDRDFRKVGGEVQVTAQPVEGSVAHTQPTVAMNADGDFVIAWIEPGRFYDVVAQRFHKNGTAAGGRIDVPSSTGYTRASPKVAMDAEGNFAVTWASLYQDGSGYGVYARRFGAQGVARGAEFLVNTVTDRNQNQPSIAMDRTGDFVIAWSQYDANFDSHILVQRFTAKGARVGDIFDANDAPSGRDRTPAVSMSAFGSFAVAWQPLDQGIEGGGTDVQARRFAKTGAPLAPAFTVNAVTTDDQYAPSLAMDADGEFAVAFTSAPKTYLAAVYPGTFAVRVRRFTGGEPVNIEPSLQGVSAALPVRGTLVDYGPFQVDNRHATPQIPAVGDATGVRVDIDMGPATFLGVTGDGWTCTTAFVCNDVDQCTTCRFDPPLAPQGSTSFVLHTRVPDAAGDVFTTFRVAGNEVDPQPKTNSLTTSVTVVEPDDVPDDFFFLHRADVARDTTFVSDPVTVTGINVASAIWVDGGSYSVNGAAFTNQPGQVAAGDQVRARVRSSKAFETATDATVTIGGVSNSFIVTTEARDATPDPFAFAPQTGVPLGAQRVSNTVTIQGLNVPVDVTVTGGKASIDGGAFAVAPGSIRNGQTLVVRQTASDQPSTTTTANVNVGTLTRGFSITTEPPDVTPDPFAFASQTDVPLGSTRTSGAVTIGGINVPATVHVTGGSYSIDGGPFASADTTIAGGHSIRLRQKAPDAPSTSKTMHLAIGTVTRGFTVTTEAADTTPEPFTFSSQSGVPVGSTRVSNAVVVSGINVAAPVSIAKGQYRINEGAFTSDPGEVRAGDSVVVQQVAAGAPSTAKTTTLTIGGVDGTFRTTTEGPDSHPNPILFTSQSNVPLSSHRISAPVVISGINLAVPVSVSGGTYSLNGGDFTNVAGTAKAGDSVRVQHVSASTPATKKTTTLTVGDVNGTFSSTTVPADSTPDQFVFQDKTGVATGKLIVSDAVRIGGINVAVPASVTGGEVQVNGGAFTSTPGTIADGDQVKLRVKSANGSGASRTVTLTVGGVSGSFTVTTAP